MKRFISALLLVFIISTMTVFAEEAIVIDTDATVTEAAPAYLTGYGDIIETGEDYIIVKDAADEEYRYNFDENTYIIDSETVTPADIENRTNDKVIVSYSLMQTMSIPPQSYAFAIIVNAKDAGNPMYTVVEAVEKTEEGIEITAEGGNKIISVPANADVKPYLTRNLVRLEDVQAGSEVLLWYDAVTMSIPAYASSEKVVIFPEKVIAEDDGLYVNGVEITLGENEAPYTTEEGKTMLPLRTIAETLGYEVVWDATSMKADVVKGDFLFSVFVDGPVALARTADTYMGILKDSKTYVDSSFFDMLK